MMISRTLLTARAIFPAPQFSVTFSLAISLLCMAGCDGPSDESASEPTPEVEVPCGGHGKLHGDHCDCNAGYETAADNKLLCVEKPDTGGERLVVADLDGQRIFVYDAITWERVAEFPQVSLQENAGSISLYDGRLVYIDDDTSELRISIISGIDKPVLGPSVPFRGEASHIAVDPAQRFVLIGSELPSEGTSLLTLVSLDNLQHVEVPMPDAGGPGVALGGDPTMVFRRNGETPQFEMYALDQMLEQNASQLAATSLASAPHVDAISHSEGKLITTTDVGFQVLPYQFGQFGAITTIPYDATSTREGRAYDARISGEGQFLYSYIRDTGLDTTPWPQWRNDVFAADLRHHHTTRLELGPGLVDRFGSCPTMIAFSQIHPEGDFLYLLDTDPNSITFHQLTAKIKLEPMRQTPSAHHDIWASTAHRATALSTDCKWAYVTHGGDGIVSIINTQSQAVEHTITTATPLNYGGYLTSVRAGAPVIDTIGR